MEIKDLVRIFCASCKNEIGCIDINSIDEYTNIDKYDKEYAQKNIYCINCSRRYKNNVSV